MNLYLLPSSLTQKVLDINVNPVKYNHRKTNCVLIFIQAKHLDETKLNEI